MYTRNIIRTVTLSNGHVMELRASFSVPKHLEYPTSVPKEAVFSDLPDRWTPEYAAGFFDATNSTPRLSAPIEAHLLSEHQLRAAREAAVAEATAAADAAEEREREAAVAEATAAADAAEERERELAAQPPNDEVPQG